MTRKSYRSLARRSAVSADITPGIWSDKKQREKERTLSPESEELKVTGIGGRCFFFAFAEERKQKMRSDDFFCPHFFGFQVLLVIKLHKERERERESRGGLLLQFSSEVTFAVSLHCSCGEEELAGSRPLFFSIRRPAAASTSPAPPPAPPPPLSSSSSCWPRGFSRRWS